MTVEQSKRLLLLLHHVLALGVVLAIVITLVLGRGSGLFASHQTLGLALAALVVLRLAIGIAGAVRLHRGPPRYGDHLRRAFLPRTVPAWVSFAMFPLILALAATGMLMQRGMYTLAGLHTALAWALTLAAVAHIAGLITSNLSRRGSMRIVPTSPSAPSASGAGPTADS